MSFHAPALTVERHGTTVLVRRVEGPVATEVFVAGDGPGDVPDVGSQAEALYGALFAALADAGADATHLVSETLFARSIDEDLEKIHAARERARHACGAGAVPVATSRIEQAPLAGAALSVAAHAVVPRAALSPPRELVPDGSSSNESGASAHAVVETTPGGVRLRAASLHGAGVDATAQTVAMFESAESLLAEAGLSFHDVVRTWIHLRDIDRDYDAFNRGRRAFFARRSIDPPPASTGIGGGPPAHDHDLCLAFEARTPDLEHPVAVMHTPTLNEAPEYGADFTRGLRVVDANEITLHVSGTASIDEAGRTAHPGDFEAQADRMLRNIAGLLEAQGATTADVVSRDHLSPGSRRPRRPEVEARARGLHRLPSRPRPGADLPTGPALRDRGRRRAAARLNRPARVRASRRPPGRDPA